MSSVNTRRRIRNYILFSKDNRARSKLRAATAALYPRQEGWLVAAVTTRWNIQLTGCLESLLEEERPAGSKLCTTTAAFCSRCGEILSDVNTRRKN